MKKHFAAMLLLAWVMWDYTVTFAPVTKKETWRYVDDHYFNWTCKFASYWQAMTLANKNSRAQFLGWNTVWIYSPNNQRELHEYVCLPGSRDSRANAQPDRSKREEQR